MKSLDSLLGLHRNRLLDMPPAVQMGIALARSGKHTYEGSVPHEVKVRRRAKSKRAAASRRINRGRR